MGGGERKRKGGAAVGLEIRPYRPGDEEAILACWNSIFPDPERGIAPRDLEWWRWFFLENPASDEPRIMLALDGDVVVGQYAGCPCRAVLEGRGEVTVVQAVDLMVRPEYRRVNPPDEGDQVVCFTDLVRWGWKARRRRPGLFVHLGRRYYERWCGPDKDLMTYGYAVPAWRIGNKYLGYEVVETTEILFRETGASCFRPRSKETDSLEVVPLERFGAETDELWERIAPEFHFALVRDSLYMNWRFASRPGRPYRAFLAREKSGGRPRGIAVFRKHDFLVRGTGLLADWLVPAADDEASEVLLGALEETAAGEGCVFLGALFSPLDPRFLAFQRKGFLVMGTSYVLGVVTFYRDPSWLRERWYYTLGDSDLV